MGHAIVLSVATWFACMLYLSNVYVVTCASYVCHHHSFLCMLSPLLVCISLPLLVSYVTIAWFACCHHHLLYATSIAYLANY